MFSLARITCFTVQVISFVSNLPFYFQPVMRTFWYPAHLFLVVVWQDLFADAAFLALPEDCSRLVTSAKADAKGACWSASSTAAIFAALPPPRSASLLNAFLERGAFRPSVESNTWQVPGRYAAASTTVLESVSCVVCTWIHGKVFEPGDECMRGSYIFVLISAYLFRCACFVPC